MNITLTKEQENFLKKFAALQYPGSPDNVGTRYPLHFVQSYNPFYAWGSDDSYDPKYALDDGNGTLYDDPAACVAAGLGYQSPEEYNKARERGEAGGPELISFEEARCEGIGEAFVDTLTDYFEEYGVKASPVSILDNWRNVSLHFTLDEAKKYIRYQGHNLDKARTYTFGPGYGERGEYEPFWSLLYQMGVQLLEEEELYMLPGELDLTELTEEQYQEKEPIPPETILAQRYWEQWSLNKKEAVYDVTVRANSQGGTLVTYRKTSGLNESEAEEHIFRVGLRPQDLRPETAKKTMLELFRYGRHKEIWKDGEKSHG